jgi:hypothetical protein
MIVDPFAGAVNLRSALVLPRQPFIIQRNSNYLMYNSLASNPDSSRHETRLDFFATTTDETPDQLLEVYWNSENMDATCRVRSAMVIGCQSTGVDMKSPPLLPTETNAEERSDGSRSTDNNVRHTQIIWPGWLCSLIVKEAHEHVPAGTTHWAAARSVALSPANTSIPSIIPSPTSAISRISNYIRQLLGPSRRPAIPSKRAIVQPHPVYNWPLERTPTASEVVLVDIQDEKRICCKLEDISELQPQPAFISHIWETPEHPDPTGRQISRILIMQGLARYFWLDYVCLPQGARNEQEQKRFKMTLHQLSTLQSRMKTVKLNDEYDMIDWQRRGWCIVEAIIGNAVSPFAQAVLSHFQAHKTLADVFARLRIHVTDQEDIVVLEMVLNEWLGIRHHQASQQSAADLQETLNEPSRYLLVPGNAAPSHRGHTSAIIAAAHNGEND